MFELEGTAPDVLDVEDRSVRRCDPPVKVWVDLAVLIGPGEGDATYLPGGVASSQTVRGMMWAQVMTQRGIWLGVVTCELERDGVPVMTVQALIPQRGIQTRDLNSGRRLAGKTSNRPTAAQRARSDAERQ